MCVASKATSCCPYSAIQVVEVLCSKNAIGWLTSQGVYVLVLQWIAVCCNVMWCANSMDRLTSQIVILPARGSRIMW